MELGEETGTAVALGMGEEEGTFDQREQPKRVVFVTVGTTCFDALVRAVDRQEVKQELLAKGYTHLLIQMGRGTYIPKKVTPIIAPSSSWLILLLIIPFAGL